MRSVFDDLDPLYDAPGFAKPTEKPPEPSPLPAVEEARSIFEEIQKDPAASEPWPGARVLAFEIVEAPPAEPDPITLPPSETAIVVEESARAARDAVESEFLFAPEVIEPWRKEWVGMPEFDHEDLSPWKQIIVSFASRGDMLEFGKLVGQTVTPNTRSLWFPKAEIDRMVTKRYRYKPGIFK